MGFDDSFAALIGNEGGFSNDPKDKGNWTGGGLGLGELKGTKFGISAARYPALDIANLSLDDAKAIYRRDYWGAGGCDAVPDAIKFDLFDMVVNSGQANAIRTLQRSMGMHDNEVDGIMGPHTIMVAQGMNPDKAFARFQGARLFYITSSTTWDDEGRGLVNRVAANLLRA